MKSQIKSSLLVVLGGATLLLGLASCSDSGGRSPDDGSDALNQLVLDQCQRDPENETAIAVNGRDFTEPGQFGSCLN